MPGSFCRETMNCPACPKAVDNDIIRAFHSRGFHIPAQKCDRNLILFLLEGQVLVNSQEYAGTTLNAGEFILQAVGSKVELLALTDAECICIRFNKPELFCEDHYEHIMNEVPPPLIYSPLKIVPALKLFLEGSRTYLSDSKICRDMLSLKRKELGFILSYYYNDQELATLIHPLFQYTTSFQYFVLGNHTKVKTVEEFAHLGGYTATTFRRIFTSVFHEPVYEWMLKRRKEAVLYELHHTNATISEICFKHGFESLPHFSNFCKKYFGASPRNLRTGSTAKRVTAQPVTKENHLDDIGKALIGPFAKT